MKRSVYLLCVVIFYLFLPHKDVLAQNPRTWGFRIGGHSNELHFKLDWSALEVRHGMNIALFNQFKSSSPFSVQLELEYARKGYIWREMTRANTSLDYLSIPVLCLVSSPQSASPSVFLLLGPRADFVIGRNPGEWVEEYGTRQENTISQSLTDAGLSISIGAGIQFKNAKNQGIRGEFRYSFGITDILPTEFTWNRPVTMRSFELSIALFKQAH